MKDCATGNIRFPVCLGKRWNVDEIHDSIFFCVGIPGSFHFDFLKLSGILLTVRIIHTRVIGIK